MTRKRFIKLLPRNEANYIADIVRIICDWRES